MSKHPPKKNSLSNMSSLGAALLFCLLLKGQSSLVTLKRTINDYSYEDSHFGYSILLINNKEASILIGQPNIATDSIFKYNYLTNKGNKYKTGQESSLNAYNNWTNQLGAALEYDPITQTLFSSAFRNAYESPKDYYFTYGDLFQFQQTSTKIQKINPFENMSPISYGKYYSAYAMLGFSMAFRNGMLIVGSPGYMNARGAIYLHPKQQLVYLNRVPGSGENQYCGYSVALGKFGQDFYLIAGAPKARHGLGTVLIARSLQPFNVVKVIEGQEYGASFGAALAVGRFSGDCEDLLVAAPNSAGGSYDEGAVYYYRCLGEQEFASPVKLTNGKRGSQFGKAISTVGDINHDGFEDVLISAPYELGGAVYLYLGSSTGLVNLYEDKFTIPDSKGFGLGLSKGLDLNNDTFNDFAIGAYKSKQVFVFETKPVIEYQVTLHTNITSFTEESSPFKLKYCIKYKPRTDRNILDFLSFNISLNLDKERTLEQPFVLETVQVAKESCFEKTFTKTKSFSLEPFNVTLKTKLVRDDIVGYSNTSTVFRPILFKLGCGKDEICQTRLALGAVSHISMLVIGQQQDVDIEVVVDNYGEPAYESKLLFSLPEGLDLRNRDDCYFETEWICPLDFKLIKRKTRKLKLDFSSENPNLKRLNLMFKVNSTGVNLHEEKGIFQFEIPIVSQSSIFVQSKSTPEIIEFSKDRKSAEVQHLFSITNQGPSPFKPNLTLLLPQNNIFTLQQNISDLICEEMNLPDLGLLEKANISKGLVLGCSSYYILKGESLKFPIKYRINLKDLDSDKFSSVAILLNANETLSTSCTTSLIDISRGSLPIWIFISAVIFAIFLLGILVFVLYKMHFFDRSLKEKMLEETQQQESTNVLNPVN